jgi:hypothetical protein
VRIPSISSFDFQTPRRDARKSVETDRTPSLAVNQVDEFKLSRPQEYHLSRMVFRYDTALVAVSLARLSFSRLGAVHIFPRSGRRVLFSYVPISTDYKDLWTVMAFFKGDDKGNGNHDSIAKEIASRGKQWTEKHWYDRSPLSVVRLVVVY